MTNRQGQQLDNYRLIRLLGVGSFGEVYLAEGTRLDRKVALKLYSGTQRRPTAG